MCEVIGSRTAKNREDFVPTARSPDDAKGDDSRLVSQRTYGTSGASIMTVASATAVHSRPVKLRNIAIRYLLSEVQLTSLRRTGPVGWFLLGHIYLR